MNFKTDYIARLFQKTGHKRIGNYFVTRLWQKRNNPDTTFNPKHWSQMGHISVTDNLSARNVEDICTIFGADFGKTKRGFLRRGGIQHPGNSDYVIWWPTSPGRNSWVNEVSDNDATITETHKDDYTRRQHYHNHKDTAQKRIVFLHRKDILGLTSYKFTGVYEYDRKQSSEEKGVVWSRCRGEVDVVSPQ